MIDDASPGEPYEVIHIRAGDLLSYGAAVNFTVEVDASKIVEHVIKKIRDISSKTTNRLIIMCDSDAIKQQLSKACGLHPTAAKSVHMNIVSDHDHRIADTLVDFFLLKSARAIHQFSVHNWGSTFSNAAHWIYDVPLFSYKLLE
jgi:hypothetical protein